MPSTVESLEVFDDFLPDFSSGPRLLARGMIDSFGSRTGAVNPIAFPGKYPIHTFRHTYAFTDTGLDETSELHKLLGFFYDRAGRHKAFWVPSFMEELSPAGNAAGTSLDINEVEYDTTYLQATSEVGRLGNYIFLLDVDGTLEYRKVTAATTGDPETLTVSSSFSKTFTQGEFACGFLYLVRFLADELVIDYSKRGVAKVTLGFKEVYDVTSTADA